MLSDYKNYSHSETDYYAVLILVLMEYALWQRTLQVVRNDRESLNPCFNGICSLTVGTPEELLDSEMVLILVLMEYALWHAFNESGEGYNPLS